MSTSSVTQAKSVRFGKVHVREFLRMLGPSVVPGDGGWPLGISFDLVNEGEAEVSVDSFESRKQERLRNRWRSQYPDSEPPLLLESRQWDYKQSSKNPIFRLIYEKERMSLLLEDTGTTCKADRSQSSLSHDFEQKSSKNTLRTRSGSFSEQYNDIYTQVKVHHIRNELEQLRNSRSGEGSTGCTCRKLHVYLPPPNAGRKAAHRRTKPAKVKEELRKRHALPEGTVSREELERRLHDLVEEEPCCTSDCPCVRAGIVCQIDSCSCWMISHQMDKGKQFVRNPTTEQIQQRCGNRYGMTTIDCTEINQYRKKFVCA
jgi:hypothetical protein